MQCTAVYCEWGQVFQLCLSILLIEQWIHDAEQLQNFYPNYPNHKLGTNKSFIWSKDGPRIPNSETTCCSDIKTFGFLFVSFWKSGWCHFAIESLHWKAQISKSSLLTSVDLRGQIWPHLVTNFLWCPTTFFYDFFVGGLLLAVKYHWKVLSS